MTRGLLLLLAAGVAMPALAAGTPPATAPVVAPPAPPAPAPAIVVTAPGLTAAQTRVPTQMSAVIRANYRAVFAAIHRGQWSEAQALLGPGDDSPLRPVALAEIYLGRGSARTGVGELTALLQQAPDLPEAPRLAALARARGASDIPALPVPRDLTSFAGAPRRAQIRTVDGDSAGEALARQVRPLLRDDRPAEAEALLSAAQDRLGIAARTEWQQRIAWSYLLNNDDRAALRLGTAALAGGGEWVVAANWVAGLAAWRLQDWDTAARAFAMVASRGDAETMAAGLFWGARAEMAAGRPEKVQSKLRSASRLSETFYGLLARRALGIAPPAAEAPTPPTFIRADWTTIADRPNIRAAAALVEIGEVGLADQFLRHQARIGAVQDHAALLRVAARLNLPATQIWLAHNAPAGLRPDASARYPAPNWKPDGGWRVDRWLVFAHALQESAFRTDAVSRAGARGLMQVLPTTAQLIARQRGVPMAGDLDNPVFNMELGQSYLEQLRDGSATGGLLPKVIAAYNAGPGAIARWNALSRNESDPLMFIETIPYAETRAYVSLVLRNYWMYETQAGSASTSLSAIAQGLWPRFPGLPGATALRRQSSALARSTGTPVNGGVPAKP